MWHSTTRRRATQRWRQGLLPSFWTQHSNRLSARGVPVCPYTLAAEGHRETLPHVYGGTGLWPWPPLTHSPFPPLPSTGTNSVRLPWANPCLRRPWRKSWRDSSACAPLLGAYPSSGVPRGAPRRWWHRSWSESCVTTSRLRQGVSSTPQTFNPSFSFSTPPPLRGVVNQHSTDVEFPAPAPPPPPPPPPRV